MRFSPCFDSNFYLGYQSFVYIFTATFDCDIQEDIMCSACNPTSDCIFLYTRICLQRSPTFSILHLIYSADKISPSSFTFVSCLCILAKFFSFVSAFICQFNTCFTNEFRPFDIIFYICLLYTSRCV